MLSAGGRRRPQFMARPAGIPGVPTGLEYLTQVDQILVHQQVEMFEGLSQLLHCRRVFYVVISAADRFRQSGAFNNNSEKKKK